MKTSRLPLLVSLILITSTCCTKNSPQNWWDSDWRARIRIEVSPQGFRLVDKPVELPVNFTSLLKQLGLEGDLDYTNLRLVEVDSLGAVTDEKVPFQLDRNPDYNPGSNASGTLVLLAGDTTLPEQDRTYELYFDNVDNFRNKTRALVDKQVTVADNVMYEDQESFRINTPAATYIYHKTGAGFARLEDREGADWIGYRPCCESGGEYRGIPNMWKFHPGQDSCTSSVEIQGPLRARISSRSRDGNWECIWDIFPEYARMSLLKAGGTYWFLYEGIPGGSLEVDRDYNVLSTGLRRSIAEDWHADIPSPEWIYFGDDNIRRVLYVVHHEDDSHSDQFWQMRGEMVVFGFGRQYRCCDTYMDRVPAHFTVGFAEDSTFSRVEETVNSAYQPVSVTLGVPERL
jgi:hypothetical protein